MESVQKLFMSVKINYNKKLTNETTSNLVLFSNDKFNINGLKKNLSSSEFNYISDLLKSSDLKKNYWSLKLAQRKKFI